MTNIVNNLNKMEEQIDLGEMINVWIEYHGHLDLNTPEEEIIKFYKKIKI